MNVISGPDIVSNQADNLFTLNCAEGLAFHAAFAFEMVKDAYLWRQTNLNNCSTNAICNQLHCPLPILNEVFVTPTFFKRSQIERLSDRKDGLDEYPHAALGRVDAPDDAESEPLLPGPLLELDGGDLH